MAEFSAKIEGGDLADVLRPIADAIAANRDTLDTVSTMVHHLAQRVDVLEGKVKRLQDHVVRLSKEPEDPTR